MNYTDSKNGLNRVGDKYGKKLVLRDSYGYPVGESKFPGINFISNNVIGEWKLKDGLYLELSCGRGMDEDYILGVTFSDGKNIINDISTSCFELFEVESIIESVLNPEDQTIEKEEGSLQ